MAEAPGRRDNPKRVWDFTVWLESDQKMLARPLNPSSLPPSVVEEKQLLVSWLSEHSIKWVFQLELSTERPKLHFQGRAQLKSKKRKSTLVAQWRALSDLLGRAHFSITHDTGTFTYVLKEETRFAGPWSNQFKTWPWQELIWAQPYPWQRFIKSLPFEDRLVHFVFQPEGNLGKTRFCLTERAASEQRWPGAVPTAYIAEWDSTKELRRDIFGQLNELDLNAVQIFIDMPRVPPRPQRLMEMIGNFEYLKNGHIVEDRYSRRSIQINTSRIVIFHNWPLPDFDEFKDSLSPDRWRCYRITPDKEIVQTFPWPNAYDADEEDEWNAFQDMLADDDQLLRDLEDQQQFGHLLDEAPLQQ